MNVALYGQKRRWAMTERGRASLSRDADHLAIGRSALTWDGTTLHAAFDEITAPLPRRVRGQFRLHPVGVATHEVDLAGTGRHRWSPIAPRARIEVTLRDPALSWSGTAYFDTNSGDEPLEEAFSDWDWCRAPAAGGTAVLYDRRLRDGGHLTTALHYDAAGLATAFAPPPRVKLQDSFWRMKRETNADAHRQAWVAQTLEDAPFYARSVVQMGLLGEGVTGVHETLSLERFRSPIVQAMLPFKAPRSPFTP